MFGWGEKRRENKEERKMGGKNVIFLHLVKERKLKRGTIGEKTSHLGPQKFISPNREENREEKKLQSWNDAYNPLRLSIWVKVSQVAVTVVVALRRSSKFHAVDFATHKISRRRLRHPQNFTSPPTNSHAIEFATHKISHRHPQNLIDRKSVV